LPFPESKVPDHMNLLHTIRLDDIEEISITNPEMELSTTLSVSIGDHGESASYTDVTEHKELPDYVQRAAADLASAVHRMIREKTHNPEALPCLTCTSSCCYTEGEVRVNAFDLERLAKLGRPLEEIVNFRREYLEWEGTDWAGFVGSMKERVVPADVDREAHDSDETGCMMVGPKGCSIYEHRPTICRDYSPWTCGDTYNADPVKVAARLKGKFTLKVLPS